MTILLSRFVPRNRIAAIPASLVEVEWAGTVEQIEGTLPDGVPLILTPVAPGKRPDSNGSRNADRDLRQGQVGNVRSGASSSGGDAADGDGATLLLVPG